MKNDWTLRWWDVVALVAALMAGVVVIQYAVSRGTNGQEFSGVALVEIRLPRPLAELGAQLSSGDGVINEQGKRVAEIISIQPVAATVNPLPLQVPIIGQQDLLVKLKVTGALRLIRNIPGFPQEPTGLKPGAWCLISTSKVELSGLVIRVDWVSQGTENRL